jgi:hypothetical protein
MLDEYFSQTEQIFKNLRIFDWMTGIGAQPRDMLACCDSLRDLQYWLSDSLAANRDGDLITLIRARIDTVCTKRGLVLPPPAAQ